MRKMFILRVSLPPKKNRLRCNSWQGLNVWFILLLFLFLVFTGVYRLKAQSGLCDPGVPFFVVDLSTSPNGTWISPSVVRSDYCCGTGNPNRCVEFQITLHPSAIAVNFNIASGAVPPGALYYQINCGPIVQAGQPVCIYGPGPHTLTFCKPGNNTNTYSITSIPDPSVSPAQVATPSCPAQIWAIGLQPGTINWQDLTGGGTYLSYLSCTACDSPTVTPVVPFPPYVDYRVCGTPVGSACLSGITNFCDIVRVYFYDDLSASVQPDPAAICQGSGGIWLNGSYAGGAGPYSVEWYDQPGGNGNLIGNSNDFYATVTGTYSFVVSDSLSSVCGNAVYNVDVTIQPLPGVTIVASGINICDQTPVTLTAQSSIPGTTWNWSTGATGDQLVVSPSATATYQVTGTTQDGCSGTAEIEIVVNPLPVLDLITSAPVICESETSIITATSNIPGTTWLWNTGLTDNSIVVSPHTTETFSVTATTPDGCSESASIQVIVNPTPVLTLTSSSLAVCDQEPVTLTVVSDLNGTTFLWNTGVTVDIVTEYPTNTTIYSVTGTTLNGCTSSAQLEVIVNPLPVITAGASSPLICYGESVVMTAASTITGTTWTWSTGETDNPLVVSPQVSTIFSVTGTTQEGCTAFAEVNVTVNPLAVISISATSSEICVYSSATLTGFSDIPGTTWEWNTGQTLNPLIVSPNTTTNYTLTGTTSEGCSSAATIQITVNPLPNVTISASSTSICPGDSVILTADSDIPGTTWIWNTGSVQNSLTVNPVISTFYHVTAISPDGCTASDQVYIVVNPLPFVALTASANEICDQASAVLYASGSISEMTWLWSSGETTGSIFVSPGTTSLYTVTGTTQEGCSGIAELQIVVHPLPLISATADSPQICEGESSGIEAISSLQGTSWIWSTGQTTQNIVVTPAGTTTYQLTGTSPQGCSAQTTVEITVHSNPVVLITTSSGAICNQDTAIITIASSISPSTFLWNTGSSNTQLSVAPNISTLYSVTATSSEGCTGTAIVYIIVNPLPVIQLNQNSIGICEGQTASLVAGSNIPGTNWLWSDGQTGNNIQVSPVTNTLYYVTATTSLGCTATAQANVAVLPNPVVQISADNNAICNGNTVMLTASSNLPWTVWNWNNGGMMSDISVQPASTTTYMVTGTTIHGCTGSAVINITVHELPGLNISPANPYICVGTGTILSVASTSPSLSYQWCTGSTAISIQVQPQNTSLYSVTVTDMNGCSASAQCTVGVVSLPVVSITPVNPAVCHGSSITLHAHSTNPNTTYSWSNFSSMASITVAPTVSTIYAVTGTDAYGCSGEEMILVPVLEAPDVIVSPPQSTICAGEEVQLYAAAHGNNLLFQWSNNQYNNYNNVSPATTTTYSVTVTALNGCTATGSAIVNVNSVPVLSLLPSSPEACFGDDVILNVTGALNYFWSPNLNYDNPSGSQVSFIADNSFQVMVIGVDANGCADTISTDINIHSLPHVDFMSSLCKICGQSSVTFVSLASPVSEIISYEWDFGNPSSGANNQSTNVNPSHYYNIPGQYWVSLEVTTIHGCKAYIMKPDEITVYPNPLAGFSRSPGITDIVDPKVYVFDHSHGAVEYLYDFGDPIAGLDNFSNLPNPFHEYSAPGEYEIWQYVKNEWGCIDSTKQNVIVKPTWQVYIPNAFTPNGDGMNDNFILSGFNFDSENFAMYIYNRWGEEIFATKDIEKGWDGSVKGSSSKAKQDVYVYLIVIRDIFGIEKQYKGSVTLLK